MLKKLVLLFLTLTTSLIGIQAAQLTATLQSGETLTPFYGVNAFKEAIAAAADGDIITLSAGVFNGADIDKSVTVIGKYAFSEDTSLMTELSGELIILADNVRLEGIRNTSGGVYLKGCDNAQLIRCYFSDLKNSENGDKKYHKNTLVEDCVVEYCHAMEKSQNMVIRNSSIRYFINKNESNYPALIEKCTIPLFARSDFSNAIQPIQPYAVYRNCILGVYNRNTATAYNLNLSSPSEFHDNILWLQWGSANYKPTVSFNSCQKSNNVLHVVGYSTNLSDVLHYDLRRTGTTNNGIHYGPVDAKDYPAVPEITNAEIDTETDTDGNLSVKISVTAHD